MTIRFVGMKELRQNMSKITKEAEKKNERIIVLRKNRPIFELKPLSSQESMTEALRQGIEEGLADEKAGRVYSQKQIEEMLGL